MVSDVYLQHHGVKGMKWGVRRYQNYDGSLKQKRANYKEAKKEAKKEYNDTIKNLKQNNNLNEKTVTKASRTYQIKKAKAKEKNRLYSERHELNTKHPNASEEALDARATDPINMTNDELKASIQRLMLEQQYLNLRNDVNKKTVEYGKTKSRKMIDKFGKRSSNEIDETKNIYRKELIKKTAKALVQ